MTGIGDGSAPGVGAACQKQVDTCQRVPDGAACDAMEAPRTRMRASLMFGKAEDKDENQAEYERARIVTRARAAMSAMPLSPVPDQGGRAPATKAQRLRRERHGWRVGGRAKPRIVFRAGLIAVGV